MLQRFQMEVQMLQPTAQAQLRTEYLEQYGDLTTFEAKLASERRRVAAQADASRRRENETIAVASSRYGRFTDSLDDDY